MQSFSLAFFAVMLGSAGQILLKLGMNQVGRLEVGGATDYISILFRIFSTPLILFALPIYGISMVFWLFVLSRLPLIVATPLLAMAYVINPLLAYIILHETISAYHFLGIAIICVGVLIISQNLTS
jgi:multidrug transporter EmrE-like cation transporter